MPGLLRLLGRGLARTINIRRRRGPGRTARRLRWRGRARLRAAASSLLRLGWSLSLLTHPLQLLLAERAQLGLSLLGELIRSGRRRRALLNRRDGAFRAIAASSSPQRFFALAGSLLADSIHFGLLADLSEQPTQEREPENNQNEDEIGEIHARSIAIRSLRPPPVGGEEYGMMDSATELTPQEAAERRAWRLAVLLTGDADVATRITESALESQPRLGDLPQSRVDRLIILRAREWAQAAGAFHTRPGSRPGSGPRRPLLTRLRESHRAARGQRRQNASAEAPDQPDERSDPLQLFAGDAAPLRAALRDLTRQGQEAWILHELDGKDLLETARAMDCSRSAAARHIERARGAITERLGDKRRRATHALRAQAHALDPGVFISRRRAKVRRRRLARAIGLGFGLLVVGAAIWMIWSAVA